VMELVLMLLRLAPGLKVFCLFVGSRLLAEMPPLPGGLPLTSAGIDLAAAGAPLLPGLPFAMPGEELLERVPDPSTLRCHGFKR
jgi:hypothetical protein